MKRMGRGECKKTFDGATCVPSADEEAQRAVVDEYSFLRYLEVAMRAASTAGPSPTAEDRVMPGLKYIEGNVINFVFGDNPLSRMAIAIKKQMLEERQMDKVLAVSTRILALIRLIGDGSLRRWAVPKPHDPLYYPDAVVFAAAVSPLDEDLAFELGEFERLVEMRVGGFRCG
jgi:hypothetical protein